PVASENRRFHKRRVHDLLVNQLLDPVEDRLALATAKLGRLLANESLDVGICSIREEAAPGDERVEPGRRVSERCAGALDDLLQSLLSVLLEERRALQGTKGRADPDRSPVPGHRFGE